MTRSAQHLVRLRRSKSRAFGAAKAARESGLGPRGFPTLVSHIDPANMRSAALAERPEPETGRFPTEASKGPCSSSEAITAASDHGFGAVEDMPSDWSDPDTIALRHPRTEVRQ